MKQKTKGRQLIIVMSIMLMVALAVGMLPQSAQAAPSLATCESKYTVQAGDTLTSIALTYGVDFFELADANNLKSPYEIFVGDVLCIPAGSSTSDDDDSSSSSTSTKKWEFTRVGDYVFVKGSNLDKNRSYYVKVSNALKLYSPWYKIGLFNNNDSATLTLAYKLPKHLRDNIYVSVCTKSGTKDVVYCGTTVDEDLLAINNLKKEP